MTITFDKLHETVEHSSVWRQFCLIAEKRLERSTRHCTYTQTDCVPILALNPLESQVAASDLAQSANRLLNYLCVPKT